MKVVFTLLALTLIIAASAELTPERVDVARSILDSYMNQPEKELFKVYHYIFEKQYSLNTQEAVRRYKLFKNAVNFIKEHNAKKLSWTVALNQFADMTEEEYMQFSNLSAPNENVKVDAKPNVHENFLGEIFRGRKLGFFDDMADLVDSGVNDDIPNPKDDIPNPKNDDEVIYEEINHINYLPVVKNQKSCGSCWAFTAALTIEAAYNILNDLSGDKRVAPVAPQQLVDCDPKSNGCNGGWMPYAYRYLIQSGKRLTFESNYAYTAKDGECKDTSVSTGIKVTGQEGCAPKYWFSEYSNTCTLDSFYNFLKKSPIGVAIDTNHDGFKYYAKGIIDVFAYENTETPYKCSQLTHAITVYGAKQQTIPGLKKRVYFLVRNSWGSSWGNNGDFYIYYTSNYNSTCWITKIATRPIVEN